MHTEVLWVAGENKVLSSLDLGRTSRMASQNPLGIKSGILVGIFLHLMAAWPYQLPKIIPVSPPGTHPSLTEP